MSTLDTVVQDLTTTRIDGPAIATEYILIVTATPAHGRPRTLTFTPDGTPDTHLLGLVEHARLRLRARLLDTDDATIDGGTTDA